MRYIVFGRAPSRKQLFNNPDFKLSWNVEQYDIPDQLEDAADSLDPKTLDAALSRLSQHVFNSSADLDAFEYTRSTELDEQPNTSMAIPSSQALEFDDSAYSGWLPTQPVQEKSELQMLKDETQLTPDDSAPAVGDKTSFLTTFDNSGSQDPDESLNAEDSINFFPTFTFNPARITSLAMLPEPGGAATQTSAFDVLAGVLEMSGPDVLPTKAGPASLLTLVLGDGSGSVVRLACWRETADEWAKILRRGDVVHLSRLVIAPKGGLSASPRDKSSMQVCYRVLPTTPDDSRLRPDLRLAHMDSSVRLVSTVVRWIEKMAGLL
ncbi:hypothetical protein BKA62DRAFT_246365 [Auriculariales sp. MPI-PUGE-AT-0066]|nr:hypothetical protein BKA62DRAFT_246365 [Auriculariales sp. MPI-PUGE-AT-0066]